MEINEPEMYIPVVVIPKPKPIIKIDVATNPFFIV
jgi:hypothetical protein